MSFPPDHTECIWHEESRKLTPSQHNTPQRLSALYQYHNAPELAPVSGLEYDDTIHDASSDKYPVVHHRHYESTIIGKVYDTNDRPPRIIFGMKVRTFLLVAAIMLLLIVGAAVGGALGGARRENHVQPDYSPANIETNGDSSSASRYARTGNPRTNAYKLLTISSAAQHPPPPCHPAHPATNPQYQHTRPSTPAQTQTTPSTHPRKRTARATRQLRRRQPA